jgi:hypothetical protein
MAVLSPAKRSGSLYTRFVWALVDPGRVKKTISLQGFDTTTVEYISVNTLYL